jgi:UDP-glucose 4-epimerase
MGRVVLVTGVSRYLGGQMAQMLAADPAVPEVIGVDAVSPKDMPDQFRFVRADIRNPVIARVMADSGVDTVVHMGVITTPTQVGGRSVMKEINVIGTMQLLAACQQTPTLKHVIVKSTAMVYGSGPRDPALFTEEMEPRHPPRSGWAKDSVEVENYVRGFARRRPQVNVTTLRFANIIGPHMRTAMTHYFELPVIPTPLGFNGRLQFVHEDDALGVIHHCVHHAVPGIFNVAGDGVIMVHQAIRRLGKPPLPTPAPALVTMGRTLGALADFSAEQVRFLSFGRGLDTGSLRRALRWRPRWSTPSAFDDYARHRHKVGAADGS